MDSKDFKLTINHFSETPKYQQLVNCINYAIAQSVLNDGDPLPSVNQVCSDLQLSRDTVFKAYYQLKEQGVIVSVPNKGYFVANETRKVLLLLDTFKAYKEVLYHSFIKNTPENVIVDVQFHHFNIENFKTIINNSLGKYSKYIIMPFDHKEVPDSLAKINNKKLLLIDWNVHSYAYNNYVFQDFGQSFYSAIEGALERFKNYEQLIFIYPTFTDHPKETIKYFERFCIQHDLKYQVLRNADDFEVQKGVAYLSVSDRMLGRFLEQCRERDLEPGTDVGFLSYNETPMKKFIYKGISVVSTDFMELGKKAAEFVKNGEEIQHYVPTTLTLRDSL